MTTREQFIQNFQAAYGTDLNAAEEAWAANQSDNEHPNTEPEDDMTITLDNTTQNDDTPDAAENTNGIETPAAPKPKRSRSVMRREAAQRGEPAPVFDTQPYDPLALRRAREAARTRLDQIEAEAKQIREDLGIIGEGTFSSPALVAEGLRWAAVAPVAAKSRASKKPAAKKPPTTVPGLNLTALYTVVGNAGEKGIKIAAVAEALGVEKTDAAKLLKAGVAAKRLIKHGKARAMSYSLKG